MFTICGAKDPDQLLIPCGLYTYGGTGTGNPVSIPIHGTVPAQGFRPAGTYQDVVTVTVTY